MTGFLQGGFHEDATAAEDSTQPHFPRRGGDVATDIEEVLLKPQHTRKQRIKRRRHRKRERREREIVEAYILHMLLSLPVPLNPMDGH